MNVYALLPLVAAIAYIPLVAMTVSSRPLQKRHILFISFLIPAMLWNLFDYLFRSNFFPEHQILIWEITFIMFPVMAVQFHCFTSSFFDQGRGRWLPFAYISLIVIIAMTVSGYVLKGVIADGGKFYPQYGPFIVLVALPLLVLAARNYYVFGRMLKAVDNPVLHNQTITMILSISVISFFTLVHMLPWGREYPISHFGNLVNACILTYAIICHRLLDIRVVLRQGSAWLGLLIIGTVSFWLLLVVLHFAFGFQLDLTASFVATIVALLTAIFIYRLRGYFFELMSRVFQGSTYDYRQQLADFTNTIHNVFSLKEQGGELLVLLTRAIAIERACLLFPEVGSNNFSAQVIEPEGSDNSLSKLKLGAGHPVVKYLEREQKTLTRENLAILPEFLGLWEQEREEVKTRGIEMFMPLISRDRLIAVLVLGKKRSGKYSLEDLHMLEDVSRRVAVSMEKEYLREQLREREAELSVINRSSTIAASSLDIQEIYDSFVEELKEVVDVSWAAIVLVEEKGLSFLALSSAMNDDHKVGENVALEGSGTEWVITHKETVYEPDIEQESRFSSSKRYIKGGLRSIVHLPLIARGEAIGSFVVASRQPYAYSHRQVALLEQLASQIAMPVANSRLYARTAESARIDELTGLLNRRSLDEVLDNELNRHSRYGGVFSLAILDLDSFKKFNDTYGHVSGDRLLAQVGDIIRDAIRASDQAFRYGGDEFAVLLPETDSEAAGRVLERVRRRIAAKVDSGDVRITASIGLASWPDDGVGQIDIIAAADMALYRAKRSGGNRINCASGALLPMDDMEQPSKENADIKKS